MDTTYNVGKTSKRSQLDDFSDVVAENFFWAPRLFGRTAAAPPLEKFWRNYGLNAFLVTRFCSHEHCRLRYECLDPSLVIAQKMVS